MAKHSIVIDVNAGSIATITPSSLGCDPGDSITFKPSGTQGSKTVIRFNRTPFNGSGNTVAIGTAEANLTVIAKKGNFHFQCGRILNGKFTEWGALGKAKPGGDITIPRT